jgi:NADP-dependent 3-hydroxy acid dehydrogenase YdfG
LRIRHLRISCERSWTDIVPELRYHITDKDARESLGHLQYLEILPAEDIANAVTQPGRVSVNEILIRPTQQPY